MPSNTALLHLLQLASPMLPVGAYAYSQGLEYAVSQSWVKDPDSTQAWIAGLLHHSLGYLDVPILARLYRAWQRTDAEGVSYWTRYLYVSRESAELQREDRHLGTALARLLMELGLEQAAPWRKAPRCCFATPFSLAAVRWHIELEQAAQAYLWAWCENQVAAATKLVPLGQTAAQRILLRLVPDIAATARQGLGLEDDEIGNTAVGLGIASALHETQYTRLFRS